MANLKTIALTGAEIKVDIVGQNCDIRNDGTSVVYASAAPGITVGANGVLSIPAGQAAQYKDASGAVYLLGTGSVILYGHDDNEMVFKSAATPSTGEGGADTVARNAINTHAGNSEIHLTAAELEAAVEEANSYSDSKAADTLTAAKEYADSVAGSGVSQEYTDEQDTATLAAAKEYAAEQDSSTLEVAKEYAGEKAQAALQAAKNEDAKILINALSHDDEVSATANTYTDNAIAAKFITGSEAASLDNCPEGCWYGQYE